MNPPDFIAKLKNREVFFWRNPDEGNVSARPEFSLDDMLDAEARLARFAPLLAELFEEAAERFGIIESPLLDVPVLAEKLSPGAKILLQRFFELVFRSGDLRRDPAGPGIVELHPDAGG